MATRFNSEGLQYFDDNGVLLAGGLLYFKETGSDTLKDTYTDSGLTTANANPVVILAGGRIPDIWLDGVYRFEIRTSGDVLIKQIDPVGGDASTSPFSAWSSTTVYGVGEVARGSDGAYYSSITASNTGNDPTSSATNWTALDLTKNWNTNESYSEDGVVTGSDGRRYRSLTNSNSGNNPLTDQTNWGLVGGRVAVGSITVSNTSALAVTGLGFKPSSIEVRAVAASGTVNSVSHGISDGTTAICTYSTSDTSVNNSNTSANLWRVNGSGGGVYNRGDLTSFDSDGFTVTASSASGSVTLIYTAHP